MMQTKYASIFFTFFNYRKRAWNRTTSTLPVSLPVENEYVNDEGCEPRRKVVYLKTHKTGSSTVASIVQRYGFINNLTFVIPNQRHFLTHRKLFSADNIMKPGAANLGKNGQTNNTSWNFDVGYEMLTNHARFNRKEFDKVFHDAKYVTIVREPVAQFESGFFYFNIPNTMKIKSKDPLKDFMKNPKKNFERIMRTQHPFKNCMHNYQCFDLGLELDQMDNESAILDKIHNLDSEFDLVMIQEYFDESLLLLRKLLCWDMDDIIYLAKGVRSQTLRAHKLDDDLRSKISSWNHADVLLYIHFNATFWRKLQDYGPTLHSDLALFRSKLNETAETCIAKSNENARRTVQTYLKQNATEWCRYLQRSDPDYTSVIRRRMKEQGIPLFTVTEPFKS